MVDVSVYVDVTVGTVPGLVTETVVVVRGQSAGEDVTAGLEAGELWAEVGATVGLEIDAAGPTMYVPMVPVTVETPPPDTLVV